MTQIQAPIDRSGAWSAEPGLGVYVHIPFCLHRCHYCDFNTYALKEEAGTADVHRPYVDALIKDIESTPSVHGPATSVFFGGGTPTLLPVDDLARILGAIESTIGLAPGGEVTVEANPETVDETYFERLLGAGFNRVSIGVQSLAPRVLTALGRTHSPEVAIGAIAAARRAGMPDVSGDLIYGSPWETADDWLVSLEGLAGAGVDHISAYALTVEEGTPLATLVSTGRVPDVDPDIQADRFEVAVPFLSSAGFERYEISNWAHPSRASAHNVLYWSAGNYYGFGAGAHGHFDGQRFFSARLPRDYIVAIEDGLSPHVGGERIDDRVSEALILGLRLASGVSLPGFVHRWGSDALRRFEPELRSLREMGLIETVGDSLKVTERGTFLHSEIATRLL